jgi:hypothetical protein
MIKQLRKYDVQTTPFIATKDWQLRNVQHQDLVLVEVASELPIGSGDDTFVSLDFIDYNFNSIEGILNTACNIALEQQEFDPVIYEEGISGSGIFYPTEEKNLTGTYKRLIYHQVLRAFYNNYHNPLQIFGMTKSLRVRFNLLITLLMITMLFKMIVMEISSQVLIFFQKFKKSGSLRISMLREYQDMSVQIR